jgi:hypothetical protein
MSGAGAVPGQMLKAMASVLARSAGRGPRAADRGRMDAAKKFLAEIRYEDYRLSI